MIDKAVIDSISIDTICKVLNDSKAVLTIINVPESIHVLTLFPLIYSLVVYPRRVLVVQRTDQASRLCRDTLVACDSSEDFIAGLSHDTDVPIVYISEVKLRLLIVENNCNDYGIIVFGGYHHRHQADVRPVDPVDVDPNRPRHYYLRRFWNRNRLACLDMLNIVDSLLNGQERPVYLSN
ncbi:hypothetical protein RCL1_004448 [Eukaryota sp. TZLM3-RCL]